MKHSIQLFVTISFWLTASTSIAMEVELCKKAKTISEITWAKIPNDACYLTENTILIKGNKQYNIVNPTTNEITQKIFDGNTGWASTMAVHPNRTKFAIAAYHLPPNKTHTNDAIQKITIYNAHTYEIERTIECNKCCTIISMSFSQIDDTLAICGLNAVDVILYNCATGKTNTIEVPEAIDEHRKGYDNRRPVFSLHPTQPLICLIWEHVYIHNLKTSQRTSIKNPSHYHKCCTYSPDGSFIAKMTYSEISFIKPDSTPALTKIHLLGNRYFFHTMAIHPKNNILLTLRYRQLPDKTYHSILEGWDINTSQCITKKELPFQICHYESHISIAPSGTKFLIMQDDSCFQFKIPFKMFYKDIKKKTLLYPLFAIKNINLTPTAEQSLSEVNQLIMQKLLEIYKRY